MKTTIRSAHTLSIATLIAGAALAFIACSSEENKGPSKPPVVGAGGSSNEDGGTGDASTGTGGGGSGDGGSSGGGSGGSDPGDGGGSGGSGGQGTILDGGGCVENEEPCFSCPTNRNNLEFLNRCTSSTCVPFNNATRINRADWQPGDPLPAP